MPVGNPVTTWGFNQPKMLSAKVNKHWDLILRTKWNSTSYNVTLPRHMDPAEKKQVSWWGYAMFLQDDVCTGDDGNFTVPREFLSRCTVG